MRDFSLMDEGDLRFLIFRLGSLGLTPDERDAVHKQIMTEINNKDLQEVNQMMENYGIEKF